MHTQHRNIGIIGGGIIGLESANALAARHHNVTVYTDQDPLETLSATVPPAFILPYPDPFVQAEKNKGVPIETLLKWQRSTLNFYREQLRQQVQGVTACRGTIVFRKHVPHPTWESDYADSFRDARPDELPAGFTHGWHLETVAVYMPDRIAQLMQSIRNQSGRIVKMDSSFRTLTSAVDGFPQHDVWVASPGMGARDLIPDDAMYAVRGQLVEAFLPPEIEIPGFVLDDPAQAGTESTKNFTYVVPTGLDTHGNQRVILGGTTDRLAQEEAMEPLKPSTVVRNEIWERCRTLMPELRDATFIRDRIGNRPCREGGPRFEWINVDSKQILVHIGHSGDGVALSFGAAQDVVEEVEKM